MTEHKPDCPLHPNWTDETLVRGLKSCTCNADKPTPPAMDYGGPLEDLTSPVAPVQPFAPTTPPAPADAEAKRYREALETIAAGTSSIEDDGASCDAPCPNSREIARKALEGGE